MAATKALPNTSKIEPFGGNFFKRWHDRICDTLDHRFAYEIWAQLKKKYIIEDAGAQKYAIANFLDFKMTEDKEVTSQIHGFHLLINDLKNENIILPESFVKNNKHERKHQNLEDAIVHIRIEEKHGQMDQLEKAKEITSKANIIENEAHPSKNQKPNK
ncbi:hypothetical protein CICLE_v10027114mg, partial [Citrus x clementina]